MDEAACRGTDPELWFGSDAERTDTGRTFLSRSAVAAARVYCDACPVRRQCLDMAMALEGTTTTKARAGIWGGLTPDERWRLHHASTQQAVAA